MITLTKKARAVSMAALSLVLVATAATAANAVPQANGSDGPMYLWDGNTFEPAENVSQSFAWDSQVIASSASDDFLTELACPAEATQAWTFITDLGTERTGTDGWKAWASNGFNGESKNVLTPLIAPSAQTNGSASQILAAGGEYSMGLACTINDGVEVVGAYYRTINVTSGTFDTATFKVEAQEDEGGEEPEAPAGTSGEVELSPTILAAVEGELSLSVPANAAATFAAPTLVDNKSTTTGTLGQITVSDGRFSSLKGWTLTADVDDFAREDVATDTISKSQLGVAPKVIATGTDSTGVVPGAPQVAGNATFASTFAEAPAGSGIGSTVLDADLTFVAPAGKAAGVYKSTMTLTVVSK